MAGAAALEIENAPPVSGSDPRRILVVDGDPESRASVWSCIDGRPDMEIVGYATAEEALNAGSGRSYDLCLLHDRLSGFGGIMLGAMIRALNPAARMVLLTEAPDPQLEHRALEHGFEAVITKPIRPCDLSQLLDR
jgi:CheY-like chemotaxis protein